MSSEDKGLLERTQAKLDHYPGINKQMNHSTICIR